ncbi:hypothetical protein OUY22_01635 [Nonomuraea sp. MCN248]|uniref:Uncharacterized protein n=1 Tax=Nonomuraea corallina TaxID=2989783 RepID=A0ABT4S4I0_9ACTN|nr:hypothetical protein [Nonomuraea corallina]MDA0632101.1 hypothetical protein [Nonomuraea corallina]
MLVGLVVTAVVLGGGGWAVQHTVVSGQTAPQGGPSLWIALGSMAAVGLVVGLVVAGSISPLATFIPSMVLLAWTVVYALDKNRALTLLPDGPSVNQIVRDTVTGAKTLLGSGVFALLGVALFVPVLMPSRWARRYDDDDEDYEQQTQEGGYY